MNRLLLQLAATFGAVWPLFFDTAFKGSALLLLAVAVALLLGRSSAATRHLVWLVAVVALLLVPVFSVCLPQWRVLPAWATAAAIAQKVDAPAASESLPPSTPARVTEYTPGANSGWPGANHEAQAGAVPLPASAKAATRPEAQPVVATPPPSRWRVWLPVIWTLGFAACALRLAIAYWLLRRKSAACEEIAHGPLFDALEAAKAQIGVNQRIRLLVDTRRTIPVVWGLFRPSLVLPAEAENWEARQLRSVLLHELAHVRRRDIASQWLTQIACALHWFNPLVWLAAWRMHTERERACDDLVLTSGVRASDYAEHLLHVATKLQGSSWTSACGLAMARSSRLEGRLIAVLSDHNRRRVTLALMVAALAMGALVAIPLSMLRAADAQAAEWPSAQGALIGTNTRSAYGVHEQGHTAFVFFYSGPFGSKTSNTSNAQSRTWTNSGTLKLHDGDQAVTFLRQHTAPEVLTVNGRAYDLKAGRVFSIAPDAAIRQLALNPLPIQNQAALEQLEKQVQAALPKEPQTRAANAPDAPSAIVKDGKDQTLELTPPASLPGSFLFRVGDGSNRIVFAMNFWPKDDEEPREYQLHLEPGDEPWATRLRIGGREWSIQRLPELPQGWLPEGRCEWRSAHTVVGSGPAQRFEFADLVQPDGRKLPLSVEYVGKTTQGDFPLFAPTAQVEAEFRVYAVPAGQPIENRVLPKAEAEKLIAAAGAPLTAPRVTTRAGNRAIIEIIREYRHPVAPGEYETDNLGTICDIEPEVTVDGISFRTEVGFCFISKKHPSLAAAFEQAMKGPIPDGSQVYRTKQTTNAILNAGQILVMSLVAPDISPDTAMVLLEAKQIPLPVPRWIPKGKRAEAPLQIESWPIVLPEAGRDAFAKIAGHTSDDLTPAFEPEKWGLTSLDEPQRQAVQRAVGAGTLQMGPRAVSFTFDGKPTVLNSSAGRLEVIPKWGEAAIDLAATISPPQGSKVGEKKVQLSFLPASSAIFWLPRQAGQPSQGFLVQVRPQEAPQQPEKPKAAARAQRIDSVATTAESAEILVDRGVGALAVVIGEGKAAPTMVHAFGDSKDPITFRVTADDRKGEWWNELKIFRTGEGTSQFPVLPPDWLPRGRVAFLIPAVREAADSFLVGEIVSETGRTPLRVRLATPMLAEQGAMRNIPQSYPEKEITLDTRLHALTDKAPAKPVILPIMAAQDLVGTPRSAVAYPYITLRPGLSGRLSRLLGLAENLQARAILTERGVEVEGELTVGLTQDFYPSAKAAWDSFKGDAPARSIVKTLRGTVHETLGGNDALLVPIDAQGAFPEKLVLYVTARTRQVPRPQWMPPSARPPILVDGWVLTWPATEQDWFASNFDYDGIPSMLRRQLERRANPPKNSGTSESIGTMDEQEVEQLLGAFRKKEGVKIDRLEQFSVPLIHSFTYSSLDRTSFTVAGEEGTLMLSAGDDTISPNLVWAHPVNISLNGSSGYGIHSGTSLCALLPGPANPKEIRLLLLRCIDPAKKPAALQPVSAPAEKAVPAPAAPTDPASPPAKPQATSAAAERPKWLAEGRVTDAAGQPMADVEIWVHAGMGSLFRTGLAKTDATGRYRVEFTPGFHSSGPSLQFASVTAHRSGFFEKNLNRHGDGAMASAEVDEARLKGFGTTKKALALPGTPREVNFVMLPAARIQGRLVGTGAFSNLSPEAWKKNPDQVAGSTKLQGAPLREWRIWLRGKEMPPGCSVVCTAKTDAEGNFEMTDVPIGYQWTFLTDTNRADVRDPISPVFTVTAPGDASTVLELPEAQDRVRFVEKKGIEEQATH